MSKALKPADEIRQTLHQMSTQFKMALPPHIQPERFIRSAITAITTNSAVLNLNRTSLLAALMKSAQAGLLCDGVESAIIPFKGNAVWVPMIGGILKLIRNSGEISTITSQIIYEKDEFSYYVDLDGEHILFKPDFMADRGNPIGVFALAKTKEGDFYFEVLTKTDVETIQSSSPSKNGPWSGPFYLEMWRKSAIKRLSKRLPKSTDVEELIAADDKAMLAFTKQVKEETQQEMIDVSHTTEEEDATAQVEQLKPDDLKPLPEPSITPIEVPIEAPKPAPKKKSFDSFLDGKNIGENTNG